MGKLREEIVRSVCTAHIQYSFNYAVSALMDNEFNLHEDLDKGYILDYNQEPKNCYMKEYTTGVVIKLIANKFFGTRLEVIEDPNNILGDNHVVGKPEHLYDSLSPLNKRNKQC